MASLQRKLRLSRQTTRRARSAPTAGKRHVRRGGGSSPITLVLCFLHAILKMKKHCAGQLRHQVLDRAWQVYQAATKRQFSQRLRRGRVDAVAPQRAGGHDGVEDVSPSDRLHSGL